MKLSLVKKICAPWHFLADTMPNIPNLCTIPKSIEQTILPNEDTSILEFMDFPLPLIALSKFTDSKDYFTANPVTIDDIDEIHSLPSPPPMTIQHLVEALKFQHTEALSIQCPHIKSVVGRHYLLWIVQFWFKLMHIWEAHCEWAGAFAAMESRRNRRKHKVADSLVKLIDNVSNALQCVS